MAMTESSVNIDKALTQHDMNASRFLSHLVINPESTANDASRIATKSPLVPETPPQRRSHRRQNALFFGCFDKGTATATSVTSESLPATNNPDTVTDSIVGRGPKTSPHQHRQNSHLRDSSEESTTTACLTTHFSGDVTHPNKADTSMAGLDNSSSHLMQWQFSKRYLTNSPVSPHNKARHTCSSTSSSNEEGNDDLWAQGVTQLSHLYANGRYQKQRGEFITEDYYFRNAEGTWNHLEWHSRE
jgi:hypothetical protein